MPETIGQQLKQAREARNLTLKKVTQATHIQARLIEAMEADEFESMPSPVQARAFLRLYAGFLDLSLDDLIARQRAHATEPPTAFLDSLPAAVQNREQEDPGKPAETTSDREMPVGKSLDGRPGKVNGLFLSLRRSLNWKNKISEAIEPERQISPSEPESNVAMTVESKIAPAEETGAEDALEPLPVSNIQTGLGSQVVFSSIGRAMRQRRESLSLTLDEIENHTHVRKHYLQALEAGDFDHLPSSVQTRGMLNNYAGFLDMDVDALLLQFADGLQNQRLERQPASAEKPNGAEAKSSARTGKSASLQRFLTMDVIVGVGLVLVLLVFAIWGTSRIIGLRSSTTPQPTAQSISDILSAATVAGTPAPSPTSEPGAETVIPDLSSTAIVTVPAAGQGQVKVVLVALEQAFVRVTVDGKKLFEGRIVAGTAYPFDGKTQIEVLTGNGAGVSILFNQSDLGPMGSVGQVVDRIYTANAILNPTATLTPTPTITPTRTVTPLPSATPAPGSTPQKTTVPPREN